MDPAAEVDLSSLTSDFPDADAPSSEPAPEPAAEVAAGAEGEAAPSAEEAPSGDPAPDHGVINLEALQALAEKRKAERGAESQQSAPAEPAATALTPESLAAAMRTGDTFRQQFKQAMDAGDLDALAKLAADDPEKADPAAIYERMTKRALDPKGAAAAEQIAQMQAKIAELEGRSLPDDVMTVAKMEEMQRGRAQEQNRKAFSDAIVKSAEEYPFLANIDDTLRMQYGHEADAMLGEHGQPQTIENIARVAEGIASSRLGGLKAQNTGAASENKGGKQVQEVAGAATVGESDAPGAIDNRTASTTAATMPDVDDEEGWEHYSLSLMQS